LRLLEADPWWPALPRAVRGAPGCRSARRARNPAARRRPLGLAGALPHAARAGAAPALDDPGRALPLRPSRASLGASRLSSGSPRCAALLLGTAAAPQARLR